MRYITILVALVAAAAWIPSGAAASDYAVKFLGDTYSTGNSYQMVHTITVTAPIHDVWHWVPTPRQSSYDGIFNQTPIPESGTVDTDPIGGLDQYSLGVWVYWPGSYNLGDVLVATLNASVSVTSTLAGIEDDIILDNPDSWTDFTARVQEIPQASSIAQQLRSTYAPGTCRGGYGVADRIVKYLIDTITPAQSMSYEDGSALRAWQLKQASCAGYTNLFLSMCRSVGIGCGFMMGETLSGDFYISGIGSYPGFSFSATVQGHHGWAAVDDGSRWVPVSPIDGWLGFVTTNHVLEAQSSDEDDVAITTFYGGTAGGIDVSLSVSGSGGGESFLTKEVWNADGPRMIVHWPKTSSLQPLSPPVTGIPDNVYLDPGHKHAILPLGNPSFRSVELALMLVRPAQRMDVEVLDINGRVVHELPERAGREGENFISWTPDGSISSGIYFVRISFDEGRQVVTQKVSYLH